MGRVVRGILVRIVVVVRSIALRVTLLGLLGGRRLTRGAGWEDGLGEGGGSGGILRAIGGGEAIGVVVVVIVPEVQVETVTLVIHRGGACVLSRCRDGWIVRVRVRRSKIGGAPNSAGLLCSLWLAGGRFWQINCWFLETVDRKVPDGVFGKRGRR